MAAARDGVEEGEARRSRGLAVNTALFSIATGLSRILGMLRESVAAALLGSGPGAGAYTVANNVPNTVRSLVADSALGASLVPVFNGLLQRGERQRAWRVASTVLTVAGIGLSIVTIGGIFLAKPILGAVSDLHGEQLDLAARLAQILFPTLFLLGISGVVNAVLNSLDEFFIPAIAPAFWNLTIIAFLTFAFTVDDDARRAELYAIGTLVGTVVQVLLPLPALRARGGHLGFGWAIRDPYVHRVFVLMLPVAIGLGLINVSQLVDVSVASRIDGTGGAARLLEAAFRVYMLPQGMFSVAVAAVLFPTLARLVAAREGRPFRRQVASGIRQIVYLLVPASAITAVLAEPIMRLLYEHGRWTAEDTTTAAHALAAFSLGLAANGVILLLTRSFFSVQRVWLPTTIALGGVVLNAVLDLLLYEPFGAPGIALATSVVNLCTMLVLWRALVSIVGRLDVETVLDCFARVVLATLAMAGLAYGVWYGIDALLGRSFPAQLVALGVAFALAGGAYLALTRALRLPEADLLSGLLRRRLRRSG